MSPEGLAGNVQPPAEGDRGVYAYGVVRADPDRLPPGLQGLDGSQLRVIMADGGRVGAVVSDLALSRPPGRRAELVAHSSALDALAATGPVVPIQFGSVLESDQAVVELLLEPDEDYYVELLARLEGRLQFNLRATYHQDAALVEIVSTYPEVRELRERTKDLPEGVGHRDRVRLGELVAQALEDKRRADTEILLDQVLPLVDASSVRDVVGTESVMDVALLVSRQNAIALEDRLETLAEAAHERMRLSLVGPLAPYDFVGGA